MFKYNFAINILAFMGYPLLWYYKTAYICFINNGDDAFAWVTALIVVPYCIFATIIVILSVIIETILCKFFPNMNNIGISRNKFHKFFIITGILIPIPTWLFLLYILGNWLLDELFA